MHVAFFFKLPPVLCFVWMVGSLGGGFTVSVVAAAAGDGCQSLWPLSWRMWLMTAHTAREAGRDLAVVEDASRPLEDTCSCHVKGEVCRHC